MIYYFTKLWSSSIFVSIIYW